MRKPTILASPLLLLALVALPQAKQNTNTWAVPDQETIPVNNDTDCVKAQNVSLVGGVLVLTVNSAPSNKCAGGRDYGPLTQSQTSGMVYAAVQNFAVPFHVDFRAQLAATGVHSTVWLMGASGQANNPYSFKQFDGGSLWCATDNEIDVGEGVPGTFGNTTTLREAFCTGPGQTFQGFSTTVSDYSQNFHVYGVDVAAANGTMRFCVDGVQVSTTNTSTPSTGALFYPLISTEVSASGGSGSYPLSMQVSYVRAGAATGDCTLVTAGNAVKFDEEFGANFGGTIIK